MSRIFITGDCHSGAEGGQTKLTTTKWPVGKTLTRDDYLIILGDFGGVWFEPGTHNYKKKDLPFQTFLTKDKPWTTLFIDGNHENFDLLSQLPRVPMFGSTVGKVRDHLYHLKRGEMYTINGHKIFTMGGAESYDKENRTIGISWWKEEVPSFAEMDHALETLEKHNWKADYVLTHTCPEYVAQMFMSQNRKNGYYDQKSIDPTANFLEHLRGKIECKKWFFGHWHSSWSYENFHMLYHKIVEIT